MTIVRSVLASAYAAHDGDAVDIDELLGIYDDGELSVDPSFVKDWTWDTVVFPQITQLTVTLFPRGNYLTRTGQRLHTDYVWNATMPTGLTLGDINRGIQYMKSDVEDDLIADIICTSRDDSHLQLQVGFC